ncbi:cation transporter [Flavobacterium ranwuense]|uniref:Cation transporter n=1 Tax=Flavobacterium ranwuense TaxID=2541725 RepID=A0ABY2DWY7_9FLAO|nr:cation transporter [Flavobacterium ranwuense]TDE29747.1 cation transporter [Flavobacterium ranwuense]
MKNIIVLILLTFAGFTVQAQVAKNKNAKVEFHVSGNCEMCKKRIEKTALSVSGVKSADWHMDCGTLYLIVNEQKTNVPTIQKAIAKVGHDTGEVKALKEDYDSLHTCCQYERK